MINAQRLGPVPQAASNICVRETDEIERVQILQGSFDVITATETVHWASHFIRSGQRGHLCTVNVAVLMMMQSNERLRHFVDNAALIVADGQPIIWLSRWFGCRLPERITGVDLINTLAAHAEQEGFSIYLLGATTKVITATAARLQARYPRLKICGFDNGYFPLSRAEVRAQAIRKSGAQILFVGMGVPRQEQFLEENWAALGVNLAIGVGGSFDVLAGVRRRAPLWVREIGLEWLYRLVQEPRRLWKRYLITHCLFFYKLLLTICRRQERTVLSASTKKPSAHPLDIH
jgi:N-acetylglucosaminyldiphosphoundecaprenol N-acetyl-beta-D-mannosaminyltransferase